jgi:hypothetical protein
MSVKRHSAAAASISSTQVGFGVWSKLYGVYGYNFMQFVVCGGRGGNEADLDSVEAYSSTPNFKTYVVYQILAPNFRRYDSLTDCWLSCPSLLLARSAASAAFFRGCVFVAGGGGFNSPSHHHHHHHHHHHASRWLHG